MSNDLEVAGMIPPGSTIGMVGSGQLGRMSSMAAAPLGYRMHVYGPTADSPTAQVCNHATVAGWDDRAALERFAHSVDVITFEWENIPVETLEFLEEFRPVHPSPSVLRIAQDRLDEKRFVAQAGLSTTEFAEVESVDELRRALESIGTPSVLKSARFGYDGKSQTKIEKTDDASLKAAWEEIGARRAILEGFVDYTCEVSVVVARSASGQIAVYDPVLNNHVEYVLDTTEAPAPIESEVCERAVRMARTLADAFGLVGVLAVEFFVTGDGRLLVNEVAPRPHNSGHWTINACHTSQFEQFIRAVCNLPLGSPKRHSDAIMQNLIGQIGHRWQHVLEDPEASLHLYGKIEARPGRKMGHVTRLLPLSSVDYSFLSRR
jgi:5-(carboxyamino)imidazole ribonucleotide synthase